MVKVILIPGNGGATPQDNWFPYVERQLSNLGLQVINEQFPDPMLARAEFWLPFIENLGADQNSILIGHSSGAIAAMRFAETHKILGSILVSAYYTDLGVDSEKQSGYFDHPWNWPAIKNNKQWIVQFAATDDPFIPIEEARFVHLNLQSDYLEYPDQNHFGYGDKLKFEFPEIVEAIKNKLAIKL